MEEAAEWAELTEGNGHLGTGRGSPSLCSPHGLSLRTGDSLPGGAALLGPAVRGAPSPPVCLLLPRALPGLREAGVMESCFFLQPQGRAAGRTDDRPCGGDGPTRGGRGEHHWPSESGIETDEGATLSLQGPHGGNTANTILNNPVDGAEGHQVRAGSWARPGSRRRPPSARTR